MKWTMKEARYGDIVRVSLGSIYHYGIFVSEEEVIQFGLPPTPDRRAEDVEVLSSDVSLFLQGGFLEVGECEGREKKRRKTPAETVSAAKKRLGERGYDILHNNCEHFANECAFGEKISFMTESLREKFRAIPIVHVYVQRFPFAVEEEKICPPERVAEIESCSNADVRRQKYFVWKLLEKALMRSFGLTMDKLDLRRTDSGKWTCSACQFSLSHSGNVVAVAVSRKPIGVDVERLDESRFTDAMEQKIATQREREQLQGLGNNRGTALNALWNKKEAIFKSLEQKSFVPSGIQTEQFATVTKQFQCDGKQYLISVASEDAKMAIFRTADSIDFSDFNL